jgi:site-specific recombinase XerD
MSCTELLNGLLAENGHVRQNGKKASERTNDAISAGLRKNFAVLINVLGFKLLDPRNIREVHIQALCEYWYGRKLASSTMQNYLYHFRRLACWIGKKGMVKDLPYYLPNAPKSDTQVRTVAKKSKSWTEAGIDVKKKIEEAAALDLRFSYMLRAQLAYGFRGHEVLQFQPWAYENEGKLTFDKTKNGRMRDVFLATDEQRALLEELKGMLKKNEALGWPFRPDGKAASLEFNKQRYYRYMAKLGLTKKEANVTGHGLRAQFAENLAVQKDFIPPTLGGSRGQKARDVIDLTRLKISSELGHARISVSTAYVGSMGQKVPLDDPEDTPKLISACCETMQPAQMKPIVPERVVDCAHLSAELSLIGVYVDPRKIQILWEMHSARYGSDWVMPSKNSNIAALETEALAIIRNLSKQEPPPGAA